MATDRFISTLAGALLLLVPAAAVPSAAADVKTGSATSANERRSKGVHVIDITYTAHNGTERKAVVRVPRWYGANDAPLPLVITPHGRGRNGEQTSKVFGNLPAIGAFAVVSPDGQGNRMPKMSWGASGQIDDLARMPDVLERKLPWLRIDRERVYSFGGSMGGQETLLLVAMYPKLLAGAYAIDSVTDFARQYRNFPSMGCDAECVRRWREPVGLGLQRRARKETGGTPETVPWEYDARSPMNYVRAIAESCVPLQVWWSRTDTVVMEPALQSGKFLRAVEAANPDAPVEGYVGSWVHTRVFKESSLLPLALARFGLMPPEYDVLPSWLTRLGTGADATAGGCDVDD